MSARNTDRRIRCIDAPIEESGWGLSLVSPRLAARQCPFAIGTLSAPVRRRGGSARACSERRRLLRRGDGIAGELARADVACRRCPPGPAEREAVPTRELAQPRRVRD